MIQAATDIQALYSHTTSNDAKYEGMSLYLY